jgi:hypothetical protein
MSEGESPSRQELPADPYFRAARFRSERAAGHVYFQAQELLFRTPCDLSAFRLQYSQLWHVAIVGEAPPEDLDRRIERVLAHGQPAELPDEVVRLLQERGAQARQQGPWSEGHYRPGRPLLDPER